MALVNCMGTAFVPAVDGCEKCNLYVKAFPQICISPVVRTKWIRIIWIQLVAGVAYRNSYP